MASKSVGVKRWIFSGFNQKTEEANLRKYAEELGGIIVDRENKYTFLCTHVLVKDFHATEKVLAALAAGKWILESKYVEDSHRQRRWLDEGKYEVRLHEEVSRYCRRHRDVANAGMYRGWKFYVFLGNKHLTRSIRRIIAAGDGDVVTEADLLTADAIISEKDLLARVRLKVGPTLPIITFHYLKETLIMKKDPALIEIYMLDSKGKKKLPKRDSRASPAPCVIIQEKRASVSKRPSVEMATSSNKKICSVDSKKGILTPSSKQTRMDQFLKIGSTSSGSVIPLSPARPSTSRQFKRQGARTALPPDHQSSTIAKYFVKSEGRGSNSDVRGRKDRAIIEIVDEVCVIDSGERSAKRTNKDDDCVITRVENVPSGPPLKKDYYAKDIEIVKFSHRGTVDQRDECFITGVEDLSECRIITPKEIARPKPSEIDITNDEVQPVIISDETLVTIPMQPASKSVKQLHFTTEREEPLANEESGESPMDTSEDLPDISLTQENVGHNQEGKRLETLPSSSKSRSISGLGALSDNKSIKYGIQMEGIEKIVTTPKKTEAKETPPVNVVLTKTEMDKLPENVKKCINPKATQIRYSSEDMRRTVKKFIKTTKVVNRFNMSYANHGESKLTQQCDDQNTSNEDLIAQLHPASSYHHSTSVRELTMREVAYYESSTDEDTMDSKLAETEKGIIIMGINSLQLFITPYAYPPPDTLGHLLQIIAFETPFTLAHHRALDLAYRVLRFFPPLNSGMRNYYAEVLKSAARHDRNFHDKLYLPWKFLLRPLEALQANSYSTDDSSMSSSGESDVMNKKDNALGLLDFIIALLSEDLKQPNYKESVREHLTWQVFWGQSQDPREITPPMKQLLRHWMSMTKAPMDVRQCLGKLVAMVMELAWRSERCLLVPISPLPFSLGNFADFLRHRIQECGSETLMELMYDLPTPWAKSVFGSIIFQSESQIKGQEITLGDIMEYGLITEKQDRFKDKMSDSTNVKTKPLSPSKKQQKSINKRGPKGETKLMQACMKGKVEKLNELLSIPGIDINLPDYSGWTPLHEAAVRGHDSCIKALLKYDCSDYSDMKNTLHIYLRRAHYYSCNVLAQAENGQTALHDAVKSDYLSTAQLLLEHGGESLLKIMNNAKKTPMMLCQSDAMKQLLKTYEGKTPTKGSQKHQRFSKPSIFYSGLSGNRRFLLSYEDRKRFILTYTNNYMEAAGIRFCRFDMMTESYNMLLKCQPQKQKKASQSSHQPSSTKSKAEALNVPENSCGDDKPNQASVQLLPSYDNITLTESEMETFEQIYESTVSNLKLCRDLTATVPGSGKEPEFIVAMRHLAL